MFLPIFLLLRHAHSVTYIACVGNSITKGGHESKDTTYPKILQKLLGDKFMVTNYGRSGATAQDIEGRSYRETSFWEEISDKKQQIDIFVVMLGTNDALPSNWDQDQFEKDYAALVKTLQKAHPEAFFAICLNTPYITANSKYGSDTTVINVALIESQRKVAGVVGASLIINFYSAFGGDKPDAAYYSDSIHPNDAGYKALAEAARDALKASGALLAKTYANYAPTYKPTKQLLGKNYVPTYAPTVATKTKTV